MCRTRTPDQFRASVTCSGLCVQDWKTRGPVCHHSVGSTIDGPSLSGAESSSWDRCPRTPAASHVTHKPWFPDPCLLRGTRVRTRLRVQGRGPRPQRDLAARGHGDAHRGQEMRHTPPPPRAGAAAALL